METKISIEDVSAPGGSILETGTENPRLEGELALERKSLYFKRRSL